MINWSSNEENNSVQSILSGDTGVHLQQLSQSRDARYEKQVLEYVESQQGYAWCTDILRELEHPRKAKVALNNLYDGGLIDSKPRDNGLLILSREIDDIDPGSPEIGGRPLYHKWPGEVFNPGL